MATAQQARMIFKDLGIDPNNYKIRSIASLNKDWYKRNVLKKAKELGKKPSELTNVEYMKAYSLPGTQIGMAIRLGEAAKRAEKRKDYDLESYADQPTIFQNWNTWSKEDQEELIPVLINALALADLTLGGPGLYTNLNDPNYSRSSDRPPLLALDYEEARRDYQEQFKLVFGPQTVENPLDQGPLMALKINELEEGYTNSENLYEASAIYYLRGRQELKSSSALLVLGVLGGGVLGYQHAQMSALRNTTQPGYVFPAKVATGAGIGYLISKFLSR